MKNKQARNKIVKRIFTVAACGVLCVCVLAGNDVFEVFTGSTASAQSRKVAETPVTDVSKISAEGQRQIAALQEEKESRTAAQRKIDSNLLFEVKKQRGQEIARGIPTMETGIDVDDNGGVRVDIRANVTKALLEKIHEAGGTIMDSTPEYRAVYAKLPLRELEALAARPDVSFIMPFAEGQVWKAPVDAANDISSGFWNKQLKTNFLNPPASSKYTNVGPDFAARAERVRSFLKEKLNTDTPEVGSQNSEGDTTHQANTYRSTIGPNGSGIKIGVLSNSAINLATAQGLGDLGPVTILPGQTGTGNDEGIAMLEIIHDLAPGAELYYATGTSNITRFAANIRDLRAAGCDIIVDDIFYFVETPFQDGQTPSIVSNTNGGVVTQAVKDVTAAGAMYFSSAGNQGNLNDNTASAYEGDFVDGGALAGATGGTVHNFGGGAQSNLIQVGAGNAMNLFWSDPLGGSANDYDLYIFNNALTTVVASSTNIQSGTQDPHEQAAGTFNVTNNRVVILKKTGAADRFFHITINANGLGRLGTATPGTTKAHSAAADAFSVAATPARAAGSPAGPFPAAHSSANVTEFFSSDGPRRIFYNGDGSAFTPGNSSSSGGIVRQKPDITAADRVAVTGVGGFPSPFSGTSAAAPHAAAIAALLKSGLPAPTNAQVRSAMTSTAIDIEALGVDRDTGVGIVMPLPSAATLGITSQANIDKTGFTLTERPGNSDGDGQVERGERVNLVITGLINYGAQNANSVSVSVTSTTTGVSLVPGSPRPGSGGKGGGGAEPEAQSYPNLTAAGGTGSNPNPHVFVLGPAYTCGAPINFTMTITYNDGSARTRVLNFTADVTAGFTVTGTMDTTAPPASPAYTATFGTQTNRVTRSGVGSTCTDPKLTFPGLTAATNPRYDAYTFTATQSGCNVVTYTGPTVAGGIQTFVTVYSGAFVPTAIGTNYLADSGSSPGVGGTISFSFNAIAGQPYTVVMSEVPGTAPSPPYTLTVRGPSTTVCNLAPTSASVPVSGRILSASGQPIRNAVVVLSDGNGGTFTAVTGTLGYYSFESIPVGTYVLGVNSKRYSIPTKVVTIMEPTESLDLVAEPE